MQREGMPQGPHSQTMNRETVRSVQQRLNRLGYRAGPVDGIMGSQTHAAITAYQSRMGMMPNGVLTPELAGRIMNSPMGR